MFCFLKFVVLLDIVGSVKILIKGCFNFSKMNTRCVSPLLKAEQKENILVEVIQFLHYYEKIETSF